MPTTSLQANPLLSSYLRTPPIVGPWYGRPPNQFNSQLNHIRALQKMLNCATGFESECKRYTETPAIEAMPKDGKVVQRMASLPLTSFQTLGVFNGLDTIILQFTVPLGYDGVLNRFVCGLSDGTGFIDGSGDIVWRVKINNHFARDLGSVLFTYGSLQIAMIVPGSGIELVSGQTIYLIANVPVASPVGGPSARVFAGAFGWVYPRH